jgi:hypothetical protein
MEKLVLMVIYSSWVSLRVDERIKRSNGHILRRDARKYPRSSFAGAKILRTAAPTCMGATVNVTTGSVAFPKT